MLNVNWEWAHLASDDKPGPNGKSGFFLGDKIHWQLTQNSINPGAQLVKVGGKDVKNWEHTAIKTYLDQFLRDDDGPIERELTFVNQPTVKPKAPKATRSLSNHLRPNLLLRKAGNSAPTIMTCVMAAASIRMTCAMQVPAAVPTTIKIAAGAVPAP